MAKGRKPAIQANQGHPGGIVDDVLIPIAKKVIRKTAKTHKGALAKEAKMLSSRHNKLVAKRQNAIEYSAPKAARRASEKITKNMRSSAETARTYNVNPTYAGLPRGGPKGSSKLVTRSSVKRDYPYTTGSRMDKKTVKAMRKDKLAAAKRNRKGK